VSDRRGRGRALGDAPAVRRRGQRALAAGAHLRVDLAHARRACTRRSLLFTQRLFTQRLFSLLRWAARRRPQLSVCSAAVHGCGDAAPACSPSSHALSPGVTTRISGINTRIRARQDHHAGLPAVLDARAAAIEASGSRDWTPAQPLLVIGPKALGPLLQAHCRAGMGHTADPRPAGQPRTGVRMTRAVLAASAHVFLFALSSRPTARR
jgi:hypothetical protein